MTARDLSIVALGVAGVACAACVRLPFVHHSSSAPAVRPASRAAQDDVELLTAPTGFGHTGQAGLASPGDAVVRVVGPQMTCSGTLIDEDLVLTAHHCVVERDARGSFTPKLVPATAVQVELGSDFLPWGNVGLRAILAPSCGEAGGKGDIAVLVLERKLVGMATLGVTDEVPRIAEGVYPQGFGRCALSAEGIRRREREGGTIMAVSAGTFEAQASICPGDSGGPVLDARTHEVVGVVSLSAMDYDETTRARSVFARVDQAPKLVAYARLVADGADPADMPDLSCDR